MSNERAKTKPLPDGPNWAVGITPKLWKLVPVVPTPKMLRAGYDAYGVADCYGSMLDAAPCVSLHPRMDHDTRRPLTDEQIFNACASTGWILSQGFVLDIARAVEAAHGIKEQ